jgi:hypothetical protein
MLNYTSFKGKEVTCYKVWAASDLLVDHVIIMSVGSLFLTMMTLVGSLVIKL